MQSKLLFIKSIERHKEHKQVIMKKYHIYMGVVGEAQVILFYFNNT
jgi:hypothetical protein